MLRCAKTKAFLVSSYFEKGDRSSMTVLFNASNGAGSASLSRAAMAETANVPLNSGIAGSVVGTCKPHRLDNDGMDSLLNPQVDLEPIGNTMITLPIVDLEGEVMGCLQLVLGAAGPKLEPSRDDTANSAILFMQAALWLVHQLAPPLAYLLATVNKTTTRPYTPSRISSPVCCEVYKPLL